ncbi:FAD-binding protein [Vibrio sp. RC27]
MSDKTKISRRQFIGVAGGVIGASMLASSAFAAGRPVENKPTIKVEDYTQENHETDVLVIGGGFAGLFAAVKAHDAGAKVMMVSKGRLGSSGLTPFAKGFFTYDKSNAEISIDEFVAQVSESSIQTNNPVFTRQLAEHSQARAEELKSWGYFDSPLYNKSFSKPINERDIPLQERVMITHLMKEKGRVVGAAGFSMDENKVIFFNAKTVVLCTGSGGFKPNGFPMCDLTHDGTIMAYDIGAVVTGKEWNDGHPGSSENSGSSYDNWHGLFEDKPQLNGVVVKHHLGVDSNYEAYTKGAPIVMGPPPKPGEAAQAVAAPSEGPYTPEAFADKSLPGMGGPPPGIASLLAMFGEPPQEGPPGMGGEQVGGSTAGMAIHKAEGIVPIDETGLSSIPGLYAAGDALGSYMSGGIYTQIGGSSAGSCVQGAMAGEAAAKASKAIEQMVASDANKTKINDEILAPLKRERGYSPAWVTQVLQGVMIPNFVLYIKKERMMQGALAYIEELKEHHAPMLLAEDRHQLRLAHETKNMIHTAEMKLRASMMRTESRCSHYRLDYPEVDYENWQAWINIQKGENGEMVLTKQPFDKWPELA